MKIVNSFEALIEFLGIKPGDKVNILTPQFERTYDLEINFIPQGSAELTCLIETAPKDILIKMGIGVWSTYNENKPLNHSYLKTGEIHYLFPGEWYNHIPDGFEIVDICGRKERFISGKSDDDIRFGCLAYGFVRSF